LLAGLPLTRQTGIFGSTPKHPESTTDILAVLAKAERLPEPNKRRIIVVIIDSEDIARANKDEISEA
jgi:hypothetical protein